MKKLNKVVAIASAFSMLAGFSALNVMAAEVPTITYEIKDVVHGATGKWSEGTTFTLEVSCDNMGLGWADDTSYAGRSLIEVQTKIKLPDGVDKNGARGWYSDQLGSKLGSSATVSLSDGVLTYLAYTAANPDNNYRGAEDGTTREVVYTAKLKATKNLDASSLKAVTEGIADEMIIVNWDEDGNYSSATSDEKYVNEQLNRVYSNIGFSTLVSETVAEATEAESGDYARAYTATIDVAEGLKPYWYATINGAAKKLDKEIANVEGNVTYGLIITGNDTVSDVYVGVE